MHKNILIKLAMLFVIGSVACAQSYNDDPRLKMIPNEVKSAIKNHPGLHLNNATVPLIIMGDFDGDNKCDYVVRIINEKGNKGLLFFLSTIKREYIIGCGFHKEIVSDWSFDEWYLSRPWQPIMLDEKSFAPTPKGDYLSVSWNDRGGGVLCWSHGNFVWFQQGE